MPRHVDIPADWYKDPLLETRLTPCGKTTMSEPYASDGFVSLDSWSGVEPEFGVFWLQLFGNSPFKSHNSN